MKINIDVDDGTSMKREERRHLKGFYLRCKIHKNSDTVSKK